VIDQDACWPRVAGARTRLAEQLASRGPDVWDHPSLCADRAVRDVVAHLVSTATVPTPAAAWAYLRAGFDVDRSSQALGAAVLAGRSDAEVLDLLRSSAGSRAHPPGLRAEGVLAELVVHTADITVAIGEPSATPAGDLQLTLAYLARRVPGNTRFNVTRRGRVPVLDGAHRVDGLRLRATDVQWEHGTPGAPLVEGPAVSLVLAVAGRERALDDLAGPGAEGLRRGGAVGAEGLEPPTSSL
jgi:uncharacterized protein (TIGR03083 family)